MSQQGGPVRPKRAWLRVGVALVVLGLLIGLVDLPELSERLAGTDWTAFAGALSCAFLASTFATLRWRLVSRLLGIDERLLTHAILFWRGITINSLLPGATLGGDAMRGLHLQSLGHSPLRCLASVALDRALGLWSQALLSLVMTIWLLATAHPPGLRSVLWGVAAVLVGLFLIPWLPLGRLSGSFGSRLDSIRRAWDWGQRIRRAHPRQCMGAACLSVLVSIAISTAFWLCQRAVGLDVSWVASTALACAIFVMGSMPVAVANFGPREVAAAALLGAAGIPPVAAAAGSVLLGTTATIQGLLAAPLFALRVGPKSRR